MPDIQIDEDLIVVTGFSGPTSNEDGDTKDIKHVRNFVEVLTERVKFASQKLILGCPLSHAQEFPLERVAFIRHAIGKSVRDQTIVGVSYGGLLALAEACSRKTLPRKHPLPRMFLVDAPLHPGVKVNPPEDGRFDAFRVQYAHRERLASCCASILKDFSDEDVGRIVTIGTDTDDIVPGDAKHLPNPHIDYVQLPDHITGHGLTPAKIQEIVRIMMERF